MKRLLLMLRVILHLLIFLSSALNAAFLFLTVFLHLRSAPHPPTVDKMIILHP